MQTLTRAFLVVLAALVIPACGLIFGDDQHWFPGPFFRIASTFVVGVALGYAAHRVRVHGRREERRDRRDERGA